MSENSAAEELMKTILKLADSLTELANRAKVDRQMVELLFAISHVHHPETADLLSAARLALAAQEKTASKGAQKEIAAYLKRMDELIAIKKTGFKPTMH